MSNRFDVTGEAPDPFEYMEDEDRRPGPEPRLRRDSDGDYRVDWRNAPPKPDGDPF